jgi:hypothetical protein
LQQCTCICHDVITGVSHGGCRHLDHDHPPGNSGVCHLELFLWSHSRCHQHHKLASAYWSGAIPWWRSSWLSAASLTADASPGRATCFLGDVFALEVRIGLRLRVIVQGPVTWLSAASLTADASPGCTTWLPGGVVALEVRTGLWVIVPGPLTGTRQWPSRSFCGFDAATSITSSMPTLLLSFTLSAQAEGTGWASLRLSSRHTCQAVKPFMPASHQAGEPVEPIEPSSLSSRQPPRARRA